MQLKLGDDVDKKLKDFEQQRLHDEISRKEREDQRRYFEVNFKHGSTTVLKHDGEFFFWGDIKHCGAKNIFHNATKIKSMMEKNGQTMGHMNYNDPPTFYYQWDWDRLEKERKKIYEDDLYKFEGDEAVVAKLIGTEPVGHVYPCEGPLAGEQSHDDIE